MSAAWLMAATRRAALAIAALAIAAWLMAATRRARLRRACDRRMARFLIVAAVLAQ